MYLSFVFGSSRSDSIMASSFLNKNSLSHKGNKTLQWTQKTQEFGITLEQEKS